MSSVKKKKKCFKKTKVSFYTLGRMGIYLMWAAQMVCNTDPGGVYGAFCVCLYACARVVGMTVF